MSSETFNFSYVTGEDWLGALPWDFDTHSFGTSIMTTISDALVAKVTVIEGSPDLRDKTRLVLTGLSVEVVHRLNGPIVTHVFRFGDYLTPQATEDKLILCKMKERIAWFDQHGKQVRETALYDPICLAINAFISFMATGKPPESSAEKPSPHAAHQEVLPPKDRSAAASESDLLIAVTGIPES